MNLIEINYKKPRTPAQYPHWKWGQEYERLFKESELYKKCVMQAIKEHTKGGNPYCDIVDKGPQ